MDRMLNPKMPVSQPFAADALLRTCRHPACSIAPGPQGRRKRPDNASTAPRASRSLDVVPTGPVAQDGPLREDQKFWSALPPIRGRPTRLDQLGDGLWTATQPLVLLGPDAGLRMTVMRMADGDLWVHNPVAPTQELISMLRGLGGGVAHIVVPNGSPEHWYFLGAFARHFPRATVWTPPDFFNGRRIPFPSPGLSELRGSGKIRTFGATAPAEWKQEVDIALLDTPALLEGCFLLRKHRTLLVSDNVTMVSEEWIFGAPGRAVAQQIGVHNRLGKFFIFLFDNWREGTPKWQAAQEGTRRWAQQVLGLDFDTIVASHTSSPIADAKAAVAAAFPELQVAAAAAPEVAEAGAAENS